MRLPLLVDGGGMVFDGSDEVRPGIEEACNSCVVLGEDMDYCWQTEDSWVGLMTESFHEGIIGITSDDKSLLFELLWLLLRNWLSRGVLCEELDEFWQTEDSWGGLMTELLNGRETDITVNDNSLIFKWQLLRLNPGYHKELLAAYPDCSLFHFCGTSQDPSCNVAWWIQYEFVVILCACYVVCQWPSKGESQMFRATTAVMFGFTYQE